MKLTCGALVFSAALVSAAPNPILARQGGNDTTTTVPSPTTVELLTSLILQPTPSPDVCILMCVDYINPCGEWYGGCYSACEPPPVYTGPPCTLTSTSTPTPVPLPSPISDAEPSPTSVIDPPFCITLCVDYINPCGDWYGGCYSSCEPPPVYTGPPCSLTSTTPSATPVPLPSPISDPAPSPTPTRVCWTICVDYIDPCGQWYGGCYNECDGPPVYMPPPCSLTTSMALSTWDKWSTETSTSTTLSATPIVTPPPPGGCY